MSYEDGPPEPTEEEMDEADTEQAVANGKGHVRIEGLTPDAVAVIVRQAIRSNYDFDETARKAVKDLVEESVSEAVAVVAKREVEEMVANVLTEGWVEHDRWGEAKGKVLNLKDRINELLTAKLPGDRYRDEENETMVARCIRRAVKECFDKEFAKVMEEAKAAFRTQVDAVVQAKLAETLKAALGLK